MAMKRTICFFLRALLISAFCAFGQADPVDEELPAASAETIAVLNFANCNPGDGWDWLTKGFADMLITDLSNCALLQVVERERMQSLFFEMKLTRAGVIGKSAAAEFGRTARVEKVLFGSFSVQAEKIEVEAHIVDIDTGELSTVGLVKGEAKDVLALEKRLAFGIIDNLHIRPTPSQIESIHRLSANSVDAAAQFYTGLGFWDEGQYEDALAQFRLALAEDKNYAQARHSLANMYYYLGEFQHAIVEYKRSMSTTTSDLWGGESAFNLAHLYEMNLGADQLAIETYKTLTNRFCKSRRSKDGWRRLGLLFERKSHWIEAFKAFEHTGATDLRRRCYLYGKVLEVHGDVVDPPDYVTKLDLKNPSIIKYGPFKHQGDFLDQCYFLKAPPGYQINSINLEVKGRCGHGVRNGTKKPGWISLCVWGFPPSDARYYGELKLISQEDKTVRKSITFPPGARIATLRLDEPWAATDYWKADVRMGPFEKNALLPEVKPSLPKRKVRANANSVLVPVAREGGYRPYVIQTRDRRLWAIFNDVGEYGDYPWLPTGSAPGLWLLYSDDGKKWTRPNFLPINSPMADYAASLMQSEDGKLWLTWASGRSYDREHRIWISSSHDGKRWSRPAKVAVGQEWDMLGFPRLMQDGDGVFWMVYAASTYGSKEGKTFKHYIKNPGAFIRVNGFHRVFITSSQDTVDWTRPKVVTDCDMVRDLWAVQDRAGVFRVVVGRRHNGLCILSSQNGSDWSATGYHPGGTCIFPGLVQTLDGSYLLVYTELNEGPVGAISADCRSWKPLGLLGSQPNGVVSISPYNDGGYCLVGAGYGSFHKDVLIEMIRDLPQIKDTNVAPENPQVPVLAEDVVDACK